MLDDPQIDSEQESRGIVGVEPGLFRGNVVVVLFLVGCVL